MLHLRLRGRRLARRRAREKRLAAPGCGPERHLLQRVREESLPRAGGQAPAGQGGGFAIAAGVTRLASTCPRGRAASPAVSPSVRKLPSATCWRTDFHNVGCRCSSVKVARTRASTVGQIVLALRRCRQGLHRGSGQRLSRRRAQSEKSLLVVLQSRRAYGCGGDQPASARTAWTERRS
jgi:hypothetical protein